MKKKAAINFNSLSFKTKGIIFCGLQAIIPIVILIILKLVSAGTTMFMIIGTISIIVSLTITYFYNSSLSDSINQLKKYNNKVLEGNLDEEINQNILSRHDEIGDFANSLQEMVSHFKQIIKNIMKNVEETASTSEEFSASSEEVNSSMEEVTATVQEMAKGAQNLSKQSMSAANRIQNITKSIKTSNT